MGLVPKYIKNLSPYVPGKRIEEVQSIIGVNKIIKLSSNENPLGPSSKSIQAVTECLRNMHRYPDSSGTISFNTSDSERLCASISTKFTTMASKSDCL